MEEFFDFKTLNGVFLRKGCEELKVKDLRAMGTISHRKINGIFLFCKKNKNWQ